MSFFADIHIHSKYSRATSKDCDIENLAYWAKKKGLSLIGTGDITHPVWRKEIESKLTQNEYGFFQLKREIEEKVNEKTPASCRRGVQFVLTGEISTIYKLGQKIRKVHHLIVLPDLKAAENLYKKLNKIGNLNSDGRPILGLDSRTLLEMLLEVNEDCLLIPAHIWTPWFSVLGSKSGFDSIEECYGDLSSYIFAVETGLSSDPVMNWRVSGLDRFQLISNSDAHSPSKLGREATIFDCKATYTSFINALKTGQGLKGTIEFFPEEGKYYLNGHRKCCISLPYNESKKMENICPSCHKPLTLGVLYRVESLANRKNNLKPDQAKMFWSFVPLQEILAEIYDYRAASKRVCHEYEKVIEELGPELFILGEMELIELNKKPYFKKIQIALENMRKGQVVKKCGYDGVYGSINLLKMRG